MMTFNGNTTGYSKTYKSHSLPTTHEKIYFSFIEFMPVIPFTTDYEMRVRINIVGGRRKSKHDILII